MKNLLCPQCKIRRFYLLNEKGQRLVVMVTRDKKIYPLNENDSMEGFNTSMLYCLGCSWKGSVDSLTDKH